MGCANSRSSIRRICTSERKHGLMRQLAILTRLAGHNRTTCDHSQIEGARVRICLLLALGLSIAGCGPEQSIRKSIKENLKDPSAVDLGEISISASGIYACAEIHSKTGVKPRANSVMFLTRSKNGWQVAREFPGGTYECQSVLGQVEAHPQR